MMGFDGFGGGMGFGGIVGMILFWGLVIVVVIVAARWLGGAGSSGPRGEQRTPLDILGERYAKGEIDQREFEQKRRDLGVR